MNEKLDINTVIFDPSRFFKTPKDIVEDKSIFKNKDQKIEALQSWKLDIALRRVAQEENMSPLSNDNKIDSKIEEEINKALDKLHETPRLSGNKTGSI